MELILRNLKIPFLREQYIRCYRVDFVLGNKALEVLGPSHYIPKSRVLRGDEDIKRKIIGKEKEYMMIEHHEWSGLRGLQDQR